MKLRKTIIVIAAFAIGVTIQTAKAAFVSLGTGAGDSVTLADLEATGGNTYGLTIGDKTFSNFSSTRVNQFDGNGDPNNIYVAVSHVGTSYFLTWSGDVAEALDSTGLGVSADLKLGYSVTATGGEIYAIDQNYTGGSSGTGITTLSVAENIIKPGTTTVVAHSLLNDTILSTSYSDAGAILHPGLSSVDVTKDIHLGALGLGADVDISVVEQSFEQIAVPEPTTVIAGILLLLPLGVSTLRILRRNRIA